MRLSQSLLAALALTSITTPALAWGNRGHEIIAAIAWTELPAPVVLKANRLLLASDDGLTGPEFVRAATWADVYRKDHPETADWHYVDIENDDPDLKRACYGFPDPQVPVSAGPARDCIVDRLAEFTAELADSKVSPRERGMALRFVLHLIGDIHQPLHAADHEDHGGNCLDVDAGEAGGVESLHRYWDDGVLYHLGGDPRYWGRRLAQSITPAERAQWRQGDARTWAMQSHAVAVRLAYPPNAPAGCSAGRAPIRLSPAYERQAEAAAVQQLKQAGDRLAWVLSRALR